MRRVALEVAIGLMLAACGGGSHGTTGGGTTTTGTTGSTTSGTTSSGTTGGCTGCRTGENCVSGACRCDPSTCIGDLTCNGDGRCAFDACRIKGLANDGKACFANGDCGCPLFCAKDGGLVGQCERRCNGTSDCPLADTRCKDGICSTNYCGGDAGNGHFNGPCNALDAGDGTCVPNARMVGGSIITFGSCVQNGCTVGNCRLDAKRTEGFALCAAGMACIGQLPVPGVCYLLCDPDAGPACGAMQTCHEGPPTSPPMTLCAPYKFVDAGPTCLPAADAGADAGIDAGHEWHEPYSLVPLNAGGVVLSNLELTTIDYAGYELDKELQDYATWIVGSSWFSTVGQSYGVGLGTYVQHYTIQTPAPSTIADSDIDTLLESLLGSALPAPNQNSLYFIYFPASTTITGYGTSCVDYGGYHTEDVAGTYDVPYGVIPTCYSDLSVVVSHELIESATDPFVGSKPGYRFMDPSDAFTYVSQGEVGDLCQGLIGTYDGNRTAQRSWSNDEAQAGTGSPCAPVPADEVFVNVTPYFTGIQPVGSGSTTFRLTGWSNNPDAAGMWAVSATTLSGTDTMPALSAGTVSDGQNVALTVTFPLTAMSGDQTVVEVNSIEPVSGNSNYWPMIFQVQ
jgi:hypothetical protein